MTAPQSPRPNTWNWMVSDLGRALDMGLQVEERLYWYARPWLNTILVPPLT